MRSISLSARLLSDAVWLRVFETSAARYREEGARVLTVLGNLDSLRPKADYNTGSIPTSGQWALYALCYLWQPTVIAEVGTFIGKSTVAMGLGGEAGGQLPEIHTCDMSNRFDLPGGLTRSRLVQYPGSSSTQMLGEMVEDGLAGKVDLFHFDGRLMREDLALVVALAAPDALLVLDDFEGIEKGVANLFNLRSQVAFKDHLCIYPPSKDLLRGLGFWDQATCALLLPRKGIEFSAQ